MNRSIAENFTAKSTGNGNGIDLIQGGIKRFGIDESALAVYAFVRKDQVSCKKRDERPPYSKKTDNEKQ